MAPDDQPGNRGSKLRCLVAWMPLPVGIVEEKFSVVDKEEDDNAFEKQTRGETFPTVETDYSHPNVAKMVQEWETVNGMVGTMGSKSKDKNELVDEESSEEFVQNSETEKEKSKAKTIKPSKMVFKKNSN